MKIFQINEIDWLFVNISFLEESIREIDDSFFIILVKTLVENKHFLWRISSFYRLSLNVNIQIKLIKIIYFVELICYWLGVYSLNCVSKSNGRDKTEQILKMNKIDRFMVRCFVWNMLWRISKRERNVMCFCLLMIMSNLFIVLFINKNWIEIMRDWRIWINFCFVIYWMN